uniref:Uncharacterized protein n=1 Tax=Anguilla anguilla TaxID=7936 RepID=A0A0E9SBX4_ANGAN
MGSLIDQQ